MIYPNFTAYAISLFTHRHCVRFTEMAFVVVAVFESGRPQFISKKELHKFICRQECLNSAKLQTEWKINKAEIKVSTTNFAVLVKRLERAGFERVVIQNNRVVGMVPGDKFSRVVALQCAKENKWRIQGDYVIAS